MQANDQTSYKHLRAKMQVRKNKFTERCKQAKDVLDNFAYLFTLLDVMIPKISYKNSLLKTTPPRNFNALFLISTTQAVSEDTDCIKIPA